jgi:hypothetical protein
MVAVGEGTLVLDDDEWVLDTRWWMFQMASFREWICTRIAISRFEIISIIVQIIEIIVT